MVGCFSDYRFLVDPARLLNDLCVRLGYCLPLEDQQGIIDDPPATVDAFTDAVVVAEGLDPVLMASEQRQQVRRVVAAAFSEPTRKDGSTWRRRSRSSSAGPRT